MASVHNGTGELERSARRAARAVSNVMDDAEDTARDGYMTARETIEDALTWAGGRMSALGDRIQEKPLQTAAIALAAGAALAWLMRR